ncbi:MAG TPA: hypothetical protein PLX02_05685 [Syntrophorhabdaceae bacterium]|nr:hypothetical protein [Syntrophorhabdaceae bacterium]HQM81096.1 hypothetical protein [Syntrophorhabdaceae bacterium]
MNTHEKHNTSKGITIAEMFFMEFGLPALQKHFPELVDRTSAGLLGEGSEMLGFDDELSRDHDTVLNKFNKQKYTGRINGYGRILL